MILIIGDVQENYHLLPFPLYTWKEQDCHLYPLIFFKINIFKEMNFQLKVFHCF